MKEMFLNNLTFALIGWYTFCIGNAIGVAIYRRKALKQAIVKPTDKMALRVYHHEDGVRVVLEAGPVNPDYPKAYGHIILSYDGAQAVKAAIDKMLLKS